MLLDERGADTVASVVRHGLMSTVNISECCGRAVERGASSVAVLAIIAGYEIEIVGCDIYQATEAARLREPTRATGSSLGGPGVPCAVEAARRHDYTADRRMADGQLGIAIRLVR